MSRYGNQNEQDLQDLKTWEGCKIIQSKNFIQCTGQELSQQLPPPRCKLGASQRSCCVSFSFCICIIAQKNSLHIDPTRTRDIELCPGLSQPCHQNLTSLYTGVSNKCSQCTTLCGGIHNIHYRWVEFVLTSFNPVCEILHGAGKKGGQH